MNASTLFRCARSTLAMAVLMGASAVGQTVATVPVGAVTVTIAAGTGTTSKLTTVSIPLLMGASITGVSQGKVSSFTSTTVTSVGAGWQSGQLSLVQVPYMIRFLSGSAVGRTFLISSVSPNTAEVLTIDSSEAVDFTTIGLAVNDSYQIIPADTLSNFIGLSDGVLAGTNVINSDNILINKNGVWNTYFYNTSVVPNRWSRFTLGTPDASNEVIRPDTVLLYKRLGSTPITLTILGAVPTVNRASPVKNAGLTFMSSNWPTDMTLSSLQLSSIAGWVSSSSWSLADRVLVLANGVWKTYFYDGTNWRQVTLGNPIRDDDVIQAGSGVLIDRRGLLNGQSVYTRMLPYTL